MTEDHDEELIRETINTFTQKVSKVVLEEFLKLPKDLQLNIILIKSAQLLLANILCHISADNDELQLLADDQGIELKELIYNCAVTGFADKFDFNKH